MPTQKKKKKKGKDWRAGGLLIISYINPAITETGYEADTTNIGSYDPFLKAVALRGLFFSKILLWTENAGHQPLDLYCPF